ncbi:MAG: AzlC family ABC transporter permease [Clostridia bacterium]|nr:AzlC family ABC transporter permease [Clostridia bacterium]
MNKLKEYLKGLKGGIPICLGYISVSFAFGIMATRGGLSLLQAVIISFTNLTSAGQFAGIDIINSNGGLLELAVATFIINIRYLLMSLSLSQRIEPGTSTIKRLIMSYGITDENFALSMQRQGDVSFSYFFGIMTLPMLGWTFGTFLGGFAGSVLPESVRLALGMAIYAMFIAIIVPPAKNSKPILFVILIAVAVSSVISITPVLSGLSGGWRVIISTVIAAGIGAVMYPEKEEEARCQD